MRAPASDDGARARRRDPVSVGEQKSCKWKKNKCKL